MNKNYKFNPKIVQPFLNEYQDLIMLKWKRFYLNDQNYKLNEETRQQYKTKHRKDYPQMTNNAINNIIKKALLKNLSVKVELNEISQDHIIPPSIEGKIKDFYQNRLVTNQLIDISNIYAI